MVSLTVLVTTSHQWLSEFCVFRASLRTRLSFTRRYPAIIKSPCPESHPIIVSVCCYREILWDICGVRCACPIRTIHPSFILTHIEVIIEPPLELKSTDIAGTENATSSFDSTANFDSPELIPRAWWRANQDLTIYSGVEGSVKYIRGFLAHQTVPFDVSTTNHGSVLCNVW